MKRAQRKEWLRMQKYLDPNFIMVPAISKLINKFYTCILNDTCDYVHVKDALPSIQIIDAIRKSSKLNQEIKLEV